MADLTEAIREAIRESETRNTIGKCDVPATYDELATALEEVWPDEWDWSWAWDWDASAIADEDVLMWDVWGWRDETPDHKQEWRIYVARKEA